MNMYRLLSERPQGAPRLSMLLAAQSLAGLAGAGLVAILTQAAHAVEQQGKALSLVALTALTLFMFLFSQRYAMRCTALRVERSIHSVRVRVVDKLTRIDLQTYEQIGEKNLMACVEKDIKTMSNACTAIIASGQSVMLFVCAAAYLAWLSLPAFLLTAGVIVFGVALNFIRMRAIFNATEQALQSENSLSGLTSHIIRGFKELKLHQKRRREVYEELVDASDQTASLNQKAFGLATDHMIMLQSILYILIGLVIFVLPLAGQMQTLLQVQVIAVILFLNGPLSQFIGILPMYAQANAAAKSIGELEQRLDAAANRDPDLPDVVTEPMRSIELRDVRFAYEANEGPAFEISPINLLIFQGEVIFVTGGNGSGKSTFLKLLTGLRFASHGDVLLNGERVNKPEKVAGYRGLFSAIFADYHLFIKLYGTEVPHRSLITEQLGRLALDGKVRLDGRIFTPLNLSTGQRKRLAHLVTLLEDRQIYIFDEWAADQDPHFRSWFYREELPRLKALGKTIIAVTHDEQYFEHADRWFHFEEGRCEERFFKSAVPVRLFPEHA